MVMYLNAHIAIDQLRHRNVSEGMVGAKVSQNMLEISVRRQYSIKLNN